MPVDQGQVSAYLLASPTSPSLQVAGVDRNGIDPLGFSPVGGTSKEWTLLIEACLGYVSDIGGQKILRGLLSSDSIQTSVESDNSPTGALFSRLDDDTGLVTVGTTPAAHQVAYKEYRGQSLTLLEDGQKVLTAIWSVTVIT